MPAGLNAIDVVTERLDAALGASAAANASTGVLALTASTWAVIHNIRVVDIPASALAVAVTPYGTVPGSGTAAVASNAGGASGSSRRPDVMIGVLCGMLIPAVLLCVGLIVWRRHNRGLGRQHGYVVAITPSAAGEAGRRVLAPATGGAAVALFSGGTASGSISAYGAGSSSSAADSSSAAGSSSSV